MSLILRISRPDDFENSLFSRPIKYVGFYGTLGQWNGKQAIALTDEGKLACRVIGGCSPLFGTREGFRGLFRSHDWTIALDVLLQNDWNRVLVAHGKNVTGCMPVFVDPETQKEVGRVVVKGGTFFVYGGAGEDAECDLLGYVPVSPFSYQLCVRSRQPVIFRRIFKRKLRSIVPNMRYEVWWRHIFLWLEASGEKNDFMYQVEYRVVLLFCLQFGVSRFSILGKDDILLNGL